MALTQVKIDWDASPYVNDVRKILDDVVRDTAGWIEEEAKKRLERLAPDSTGTLASEIKVVKSKFENGGWVVEAQGHGNYKRYYASFQELGSVNNAPKMYLRQPLRRSRFRMRKMVANAIGAIVR